MSRVNGQPESPRYLNELVKFVEQTNMYRWYDTEIINAVQKLAPARLDLVEYFRRETIWHKDEILKKLYG